MPNYKEMYYDLFNAVTDAIRCLQNAQLSGEAAYIESEDVSLTTVSNLTGHDETVAK